ncbi:MAG: hypothetical protein IPN16_24585 [Gemmatimonadetes bacterium]|nr:hypothetical protein [Gemmatimonadota bacterium]
MTERVLHIAYLPPTGYVHPLSNALNAATSPRAKQALEKWYGEGVGSIALALSSKLAMLSVTVARLNRSLNSLRRDVASNPRASDALAEQKALPLTDAGLAYDVLVDIDAFVFEFRSAYEILGKFLAAVHRAIEEKPPTEAELLAMLESKGVPTAWTTILREKRKRLFHEKPPWIAYQIDSLAPFSAREVFTSGA